MKRCLTSRVMLQYEIFQTLVGHMGIYLGGRQVGMAKHDLHRSKVRSIIHEMGSKCMAKRMGRNLLFNPGVECVALNGVPKRLTGHNRTSSTRKQHRTALR